MDNIENAVICDKCGEFVIPDNGKCPVCGGEIDLSKSDIDIEFDGDDTIDDFEFGDADDFVPSDDDVELDLGDDDFVGDDIDFSELDDFDFGDDSDGTDGGSGDEEIDF